MLKHVRLSALFPLTLNPPRRGPEPRICRTPETHFTSHSGLLTCNNIKHGYKRCLNVTLNHLLSGHTLSSSEENHVKGKSADTQLERVLSVRVQEVRQTPQQHSALNRT